MQHATSSGCSVSSTVTGGGAGLQPAAISGKATQPTRRRSITPTVYWKAGLGARAADGGGLNGAAAMRSRGLRVAPVHRVAPNARVGTRRDHRQECDAPRVAGEDSPSAARTPTAVP